MKDAKRRWIGLAGVAIALGTTLVPAQASARVDDITSAQMAMGAELAVECYLHPTSECLPACDFNNFDNDPDCPKYPPCTLYWASGQRVSLSKRSNQEVDADAHLKCGIPSVSPDVTVHIQMAFTCGDAHHPDVTVSAAATGVTVDWPWWVDAFLSPANVTWWAGNIISRIASSQIIAAGVAQRLSFFQYPLLGHCPSITVNDDPTVIIDTSVGNECRSGERYHERCDRQHQGPGLDWECIGGRWAEVSGGYCEPKAPRDGDER